MIHLRAPLDPWIERGFCFALSWLSSDRRVRHDETHEEINACPAIADAALADNSSP